ncbi:hypothetical protein [Lactococcus lactis]
MKKTLILLPALALVGYSSFYAMNRSAVFAESQTRLVQQASLHDAIIPQITDTTFIHYNTIHINIRPIKSTQASVLLTYTNQNEDFSLGKALYNDKGELTGFEINLADIANNPVANESIASSLKFKVIDSVTGELSEYPIIDSELIDNITHAIDYGAIENFGLVSAGTKSPNFSLYFGEEIFGNDLLQGQITSLTGSLQLTDKQSNNRNLIYRLVDDEGNLVGRISRDPNKPSVLFIGPSNNENFVGNQQYHLTVTNIIPGTTEEVFTFTTFNIF